MELNWNQEDSIYPFYNDANIQNGNEQNLLDRQNIINNGQINQNPLNPLNPLNEQNNPFNSTLNPLKMHTNLSSGINRLDNPLLSRTNTSDFKLIPLPDDIFGFDPVMNDPMGIPLPNTHNPTNSSFNINNYIDTNVDTNFLEIKHDVNQDLINDDDIEKVLFDLGISEPPTNSTNFKPQESDVQSTTRRTHKRQLSGSAIFGFIGDGDNTQLSIPGIDPVQFVNKKPLYKDITNFNNIDFNKTESSFIFSNNAPLTPKRQKTSDDKPEYFVSGGNPKSYKFPPSPPRGSFSFPNERENVATSLQSVNHANAVNPNNAVNLGTAVNLNNSVNFGDTTNLHKSTIFNPISVPTQPVSIPDATTSKNIIDTTEMFTSSPIKNNQSSPFHALPMSSPVRRNPFQTPISSPRKNMIMSQLASQSKFKVSKDVNKSKTEDTTILLDEDENDDNDKTISAMNTPSKKNYVYDYLNTPTKKKILFSNGNDEISKENGSPQRSYLITQKMKGFSKRPLKRKVPTIATTLATGTLDQYFEGPSENNKYTCKFFDKELQCVCEREFGRISNIRAHIQTHLSDRPFVCEICQKAFVRNHDLKRHKNGHSGVPNTCACGKTFPRIDALKRHQIRNICIGGTGGGKDKGVTKPGANVSKVSAKVNIEDIKQSLDIAEQKHKDTYLKSKEPEKREMPVKQQEPVLAGYQNMREQTPIIETRAGTANPTQQGDMTSLFNFNEIPIVDGEFNFDLEDSLVV